MSPVNVLTNRHPLFLREAYRYDWVHLWNTEEEIPSAVYIKWDGNLWGVFKRRHGVSICRGKCVSLTDAAYWARRESHV